MFNTKGFIGTMIRMSFISNESKKYWLNRIHTLNNIGLKRLYEILKINNIKQIDSALSKEKEYKTSLKGKLNEIVARFKSFYKKEENKLRIEEDPDKLLAGL